MNIDTLNDKQKEAVLKTDGEILILAGPGSGKTRVITHKIAYILEKELCKPSEILAITFTNKAAKEMKERLQKLVDNIKGMQVSTFHAFGLKIIRENSELLGLKSNFSILDEQDTISLIKKILSSMNLDEKMYNAKAIKYRISSSKNELIDSNKFKMYVNNEIDEKVREVYQKYEQELIKNNSVDFDDLLMMPITLFNKHKDVLEHYQNKYKYIFIDEYQDTNEAQYLLCKMISAKNKNICVVGDESQSIYSWRGANYKNILNFEKDYKNATVILLEQNYRSTKRIVEAANTIIKFNKEKKDKNLWTDNEDGNKIQYLRCYDEKDEVLNIIREIKAYNSEGVPYKEMSVLYRTNAQSQIIERTFIENSIPYKVVGAFAYFNRKEIKDLMAYLRLINNFSDNISLERCINAPKRGIGNKTIERLDILSKEKNMSMFEVINSGKELEFKNMIIELMAKQEKLNLVDFIELVLDKTGLRSEYEKEDNIESKSKLENLEEFKSIAKNYEDYNNDSNLENFLMELSLVSDRNEDNNDDVVTLMTMHAAKGLEFDVVFVTGLEEGIFPHSFNSECEDIEEERRLFYVAITRAKKYLYLTNARSRLLYGQTRCNRESDFIEELNALDIDRPFDRKIIVNSNNNLDNNDASTYKVGDHVFHNIYKEGIIASIDEKIATIIFVGVGIKKILTTYKGLRKM